MSNLAKLKKQAADFEQKKQFERALEIYEEVLQAQDGGEDADISLHNRAGDLQLRLGRMGEALRFYERAADLYAERGFLNNAIALCNKILRQDPQRAEVHYKLGRACAAKGFRSDARQHFVTYAELMQRAGRLDDALSALQECADLAAAQDDLRLLLADHLTRHDRAEDAIGQLRIVLARAEAEHRLSDAEDVRARIRVLDPAFAGLAPQAEGTLTESAEYAVPRPSGPRPRAMPELVLIEPTESGAGPTDDRRAPSEQEKAARPSRPSGALLMPEEIIRGADADLRSGPAAGSDEPGIDDLLPVGPEAGLADPAEWPATADASPAAAAGDMQPFAVLEGGSVLSVDFGAPGADAEHAAAEPLDLEFGGHAAPTADAGASGVDAADFALPSFDDVGAESAADGAGAAARAGDELLSFSMEPDGATPAEPGARADGTDDGSAGELDGAWIVAPSEVGAAGAPAARTGEASAAVGGPSPSRHARLASARAGLATGDVDGALRAVREVVDELDAAGQAPAADAALDELLELAPTCLPLHERRVARYGARGATARIVSANLALAAAARAAGEEQLARVAYARVLEVAPDNAEAAAVLGAGPRDLPRGVRPVAPTPVVAPRALMPTPMAVRPVPATPIGTRAVEAAADDGAGDFVNLGDLLRDEGGPRSTRMVVEERAPSGDEEADFAAMLTKFKQGVAENVDDEDHDSHYDLGVAYKEMGLVDEAIASFQRALRGTTRRARTYEALGQCFIERGQHAVAAGVLQRATQEAGLDDHQLVGVLYLLGRAAEAMNQRSDAVRYYERVLAVDITFSDVADRIGAVEQVGT